MIGRTAVWPVPQEKFKQYTKSRKRKGVCFAKERNGPASIQKSTQDRWESIRDLQHEIILLFLGI